MMMGEDGTESTTLAVTTTTEMTSPPQATEDMATAITNGSNNATGVDLGVLKDVGVRMFGIYILGGRKLFPLT